ncbi:GDSL esterase/lipase At5g45670-like [Neltuma alba]|uniref:GDSL esterase/lipase At5g45670-like n=1 Tax=Neltuma alba TaxID=207710 RepID=UPI0010A2CA58|nr:GDSL esterase/lipase At5g45670-like [Prosopis alba]
MKPVAVGGCNFYLQNCVRADSLAPCFFIFGDSLSDSGNNNFLPTTAKANYFPYGIDFPGGSTGRFTNNFNSVDYLAKFMGVDLIQPFTNTSGSNILKGVNYASGAGGILDDTGILQGDRLNLRSQITKHKLIFTSVAVKLGGVDAAKQYLSKCLYHMNIGRNDYFDNYLKPFFSLTTFTDDLIARYALQIKALYGVGARKFALVGLGPIGCVPRKRNTNEYNGKASFIMVNSSAISSQSPAFLALKNKNDSCCKTVSSTGLCVKNVTPCQDRDNYVFWDGLHTTDAAHKIYALSQFNASNSNFTYPMDITHLLSLSLSS